MILFTLQLLFIATLFILWFMFVVSVLTNWWVRAFPKSEEEPGLSRKDVVALIKAELNTKQEEK